MRTETTTRNIYPFDELDDKAKEKAIDDYRACNFDDFRSREWLDSLKGFAESTGLAITDYQLAAYDHSYVTWRFIESGYDPSSYDSPMWDIDLLKLSGLRLRTWLVNNWQSAWTKGRYMSTSERHVNGKYIYKTRYSKCQSEISCPFTGVFSDHDLIDPVLAFIAKPDGSCLSDVIDACMDSFIKGYQTDLQDMDSSESITETIEANEYEFYSNGAMI